MLAKGRRRRKYSSKGRRGMKLETEVEEGKYKKIINTVNNMKEDLGEEVRGKNKGDNAAQKRHFQR